MARDDLKAQTMMQKMSTQKPLNLHMHNKIEPRLTRNQSK